ncbi:MAG: acyl-CoA/acyl-ACP dehydrogenase [Kordiimonadaceae bacterium]|nr:acyl-CoA/acyl-ACP dehydrogenase [Kordiimonadaceae bacterium]
MYFDLTEEQFLFQDSLAKFVEDKCGLTRLGEIFDSEDGFDKALWQNLIDLGVGPLLIEEQYGGLGLGLLDGALVAETFGYKGTPGPFMGHMLASLAIQLAGNEDQKAKWLPALAAGELVGTVALSEAGDLWQPEQWTVESGTAINGTKTNVPYGSAADLIIIGLADGTLGIIDGKSDSISAVEVDVADRGRRLSNLTFENTPCDMLHDGKAAAPQVRDAALILLAADAYGGAKRCLEMAVDYAKVREQFGKPIGHFQAMKHQLADMALETEPCRGLYWFAAHAFDEIKEEAPRAAAVAKAHNTECFLKVSRLAVEAHGGIGYTWEYPLHMWAKRAMFDRIYFGSPSTHRARAADMAGW